MLMYGTQPPESGAWEKALGDPPEVSHDNRSLTPSEMAKILAIRSAIEIERGEARLPYELIVQFLGLVLPYIDDNLGDLRERIQNLEEQAAANALPADAAPASHPEEPKPPIEGTDNIRRVMGDAVRGAGLALPPDLTFRVGPGSLTRGMAGGLHEIIYGGHLLSAAKLPYNKIPKLPEGMDDAKLADWLARYGMIVLRHSLEYRRGPLTLSTQVVEGSFGEVSYIPGYNSMAPSDSNPNVPTLSDEMAKLLEMLATVAAMTHESTDKVEKTPGLAALAKSWLELDKAAQYHGVATFDIVDEGGIPIIKLTPDGGGKYFFVFPPIENGLTPILSNRTIKRQDGRVQMPDPLVIGLVIGGILAACAGVYLNTRNSWGHTNTIEDFSAGLLYTSALFMGLVASQVRAHDGLPIDTYGVAHGLFGITGTSPGGEE